MAWLYVPSCTPSASAPEEEALILASNWRFQVLAQSAWSRGKPSAPRDWHRRWKTASWLQRLCGLMPEPSTAALGVDAWTASLAASRASLIPSPANDAGKRTSATSGASPGGSSSSLAPGLSSSKTSAACSPAATPISGRVPSGYGETYSGWVSRLREDCSRRQRSARRMSASASSSSAWPTPAARDIKGANSADHLQKSSGSLHLDQLPNFVAHVWATPTASENSNRTTRMAPSHGKGHGIVLAGQACDFSQQWSTPAVADVQGGRKARSGDRSTELLLNGQAEVLTRSMWPTPATRDHHAQGASHNTKAQSDSLATVVAHRLGPLDPTTSTAGETSSPSGRKLNPLFVEMLMGWPPGWTNFACSETALSHWRRRMRSELSRIDFHDAPPEQPSLFG